MTMLSRTGSLFALMAFAALAACTDADENAVSVDGSESAQTPTSGALPPEDRPASKERPTPSPVESTSSAAPIKPGMCSADLYPTESAGYVCGTLEFGPLAPVDARAYESEGGGGVGGGVSCTPDGCTSGGPGAQWVNKSLTIVFSETRNECEFINRGVAPSKRNRLSVELITQSGNLFDPKAYPNADRIEPGTYENAGKRNAGPGQIYEIHFRSETGEGCSEGEQGAVYGAGKGQWVDSYASGTVTIKERTATSVSGVIDAADMLGHWVKIEFTAPICGGRDISSAPKCCAPGQSG